MMFYREFPTKCREFPISSIDFYLCPLGEDGGMFSIRCAHPYIALTLYTSSRSHCIYFSSYRKMPHEKRQVGNSRHVEFRSKLRFSQLREQHHLKFCAGPHTTRPFPGRERTHPLKFITTTDIIRDFHFFTCIAQRNNFKQNKQQTIFNFINLIKAFSFTLICSLMIFLFLKG